MLRNNKIEYTVHEESWLSQIKDSDTDDLWERFPAEKLAQLANIYGGAYPEIFSNHVILFDICVNVLIDYCRIHQQAIPELKVRHNLLVNVHHYNKEMHILQVPKTKKNYLSDIQTTFSPRSLDHRNVSAFRSKRGLFIYSNDVAYVSGYFTACYTRAEKSSAAGDSEFTLLSSLLKKPERHNIGIVVGNGNILSLLPDLDVDDIILLDIEPAVLYFVFSVRNIILTAPDNNDFSVTKDEINFEVGKLEDKILSRHHSRLFGCEKKLLGEKHFLSSKLRFEQCKKSLEEKELLPMMMNVFDREQMKALAEKLKSESCRVAFMNLTNINDYDDEYVLIDILRNFHLTSPCKIVTTSIVDCPSENLSARCYVSTTLAELEANLRYRYERNVSGFSCMFK